MTKKSLSEWWEETHGSSHSHGAASPPAQEEIEALYDKLGRNPAVDSSLEILRKEMAAVYRDMRSGRIDSNDGLRLAHVLDLLRKSHDAASIPQRLKAIEAAMGLKPENHPGWLGISFDSE
jgi:hypothetical protein